jgi:hypothetical protein
MVRQKRKRLLLHTARQNNIQTECVEDTWPKIAENYKPAGRRVRGRRKDSQKKIIRPVHRQSVPLREVKKNKTG